MAYIELEAAKDAIIQYIAEQTVSKYPSAELCKASRMGGEGVIYELETLPTADVEEVKHGEWLLHHVGHGHYWECSVCHADPCIYITENTNYCPNCGAKMDGKEDAE